MKAEHQDIPSEWYQYARDAGTIVKSDGRIMAKYPSRLVQPGTWNQNWAWNVFRDAVDCWTLQPLEGGVEPPELGPRNRSWWYMWGYDFSVGYYNYFMKHTLNSYYAEIEPDWCFLAAKEDTYVRSTAPDVNFSTRAYIRTMIYNAVDEYIVDRAYLKTPGLFNKTLWIRIGTEQHDIDPVRKIRIIPIPLDSYTAATLTWNTQPDITGLYTEVDHPSAPVRWWGLDIGMAEAVCIAVTTELGADPWEQQSISMRSTRYPFTAWRPWYHKYE